MSSKFCKNCGKALNEDTLFCQYCGTPVAQKTINEKKQVAKVADPKGLSQIQKPQAQVQNPQMQKPQAQVQNPQMQKPQARVQNPQMQKPQAQVQNPQMHKSQAQVQNPQAPATKVKKKKKGCVIAVLVFMSIIILFIIGIITLVKGLGDGDIEWEKAQEVEIEPLEVDTHAEGPEGIEVVIPPFLIDEDMTLTMAVVEDTQVNDKINEMIIEGQEILKVMEFELGDIEAFDDFIEIRVPFESMGITYDEAVEGVAVYTLDEATNELVIEMVDVEQDSLVFYVNHFSKKIIIRDPNGESFASKVRKADLLNVSSEDIEQVISEIQDGGNEADSLAKLSFKAIENGTSWAGNFTTFTSVAQHSTTMKGAYDKLSLLGNTLFYIKCASAVNESLETGSYNNLAKIIVNDGLGYIIGNFAATPVKLAYTGATIMKYVGDNTIAYFHEGHDEAFMQAVPILVSEYFEAKADGLKVSGVSDPQVYHYKKTLKDELLEVARESGSPEAVEEKSQEMIDSMVNELLKDEFYRERFDELVENYVASKQSESLYNYITMRDVERVPEDALKEMRALVTLEMKPVLQLVAKELQTEAEQDYYRNFIKLVDEMSTDYQLEFKITGSLPEGVMDMVMELYDSGLGMTLYDFTPEGKTDSRWMSFETYSSLGSPNAARLILLMEDGDPQIYQVAYQYKMENHEIVFAFDDQGDMTNEELEDQDVINDDDMEAVDDAESNNQENTSGDEDLVEFDLDGGVASIDSSLYGNYQGSLVVTDLSQAYYDTINGVDIGADVGGSATLEADGGTFITEGVPLDVKTRKVVGNQIEMVGYYYVDGISYYSTIIAQVNNQVMTGEMKIYEGSTHLITAKISYPMVEAFEYEEESPAIDDQTIQDQDQYYDFNGTFYVVLHFPTEKIQWSLIESLSDIEIDETERVDYTDEFDIQLAGSGNSYYFVDYSEGSITVNGNLIKLRIPEDDLYINAVVTMDTMNPGTGYGSVNMEVMGEIIAEGSITIIKQ